MAGPDTTSPPMKGGQGPGNHIAPAVHLPLCPSSHQRDAQEMLTLIGFTRQWQETRGPITLWPQEADSPGCPGSAKGVAPFFYRVLPGCGSLSCGCPGPRRAPEMGKPEPRVPGLDLPIMTWSKTLNFLEPRFLCLLNGNSNPAYSVARKMK